MSTFSSSKKRFNPASPTRGDSGNKEVLISQLRAEIIELKSNEREYFDLSSQLKKLESRYSVLQDEKARGESDFKTRNTINFDTIANLRTDVDTLKANIADTKIEIQDLRSENQTVKDVADQRGVEVQRLKAEVGSATEDNNNLSDNKRRLEAEMEIAREEKRRVTTQLKDSRSTLDEFNHKNNELEKVMKDLEYRNSKLERQNAQTQQNVDNLTGESKTRTENLEVIEQQVADSQKAIVTLEKDIQEAEKDNERSRVEATKSHKSYQQEVGRSLEFNARIAVLENALRAKEAELTELKRDQDNLKNSHSNLLDNNFQLKSDLDACRTDIDGISTQNSEIVEELDRLTLEDEQVRSILNRSDRVEALRFKSESQLRKSGFKSTRNQFSPSPDRNHPRSPLSKSSLKSSSIRKSPVKH
jgi:chromosome segregation ATPase